MVDARGSLMEKEQASQEGGGCRIGPRRPHDVLLFRFLLHRRAAEYRALYVPGWALIDAVSSANGTPPTAGGVAPNPQKPRPCEAMKIFLRVGRGLMTRTGTAAAADPLPMGR